MLRDCQHLNVYTDMCPHVANRGLGQPITGPQPSSSSSSSWFATHQCIAEMIFHARVENHPCRTLEPRDANLFYVPFYGGLHASSKFREADLVERDRLAMELVEYLIQQPWWQRKQGRDHFLALGRTAWDFMRGEVDFGANSFLNIPEVKNMSVLIVERHPWEGHNQHGIPYPSYLHPSTSDELVMWQEKMRHMERPYLFSFVGAPRTGVQKAAIRDEILSQCSKEQSLCHLLKCGRVGASKCHNPSEVLKVMTKSQFCLQAPGDSFTRRSTFDSILAGCIPVFFSPHTAYTQYAWYLPKETTEYSVYIPIPEDQDKMKNNVVDIEKELKKIPKEKVEKMRNTVIGLIPRLTYMHPNSTNTSSTSTYLKDAVDVALEKLSNHVVNLTSSSLLPLPTI
ncbi:Xyloglucan galactosyltransferase katamari1-like protein [Thalictrum thalictroides]|uniref:Xyloglucan galactosyltransferase katamari1-like protein n=1 Tax=Thalictrum thalictroides TaxID=46969 RepID=A0A7J6UR95_THATH|nr:Xyloglucan galactosyltransferase katamari1-like protein [Thalictrum thalictroides]